jgi:hypothetical protein
MKMAANRLKPEQEEFVRRNWKKLSVRQLAETLEVRRADVETLVRQNAAVWDAAAADSDAHELRWLIGLFVAALAIRLYYLHVIVGTPFFEPLSPFRDDGVYDVRGMQIAHGDWLGSPSSWLVYANPLYPYFLGVIYWAFGRSLGVVHGVQTMLGALTPLLIHRLAKDAFGRASVARIAGVLSAAYIPFVFYENLLLGESLAIFLGLCALCLLARIVKSSRPRWGSAVSAGLLFGGAALLRPNFLLTSPFLALALVACRIKDAQARRTHAALAVLFMLGVALGVAPIAAKNYYVYHDFVLVSAQGGANLYIGNDIKSANGPGGEFGTSMKEIADRSVAEAEQATGHKLKPSEVSSFWVHKTIENFFSAPVVFSIHMAQKSAQFLNSYEIPDVLNIMFAAEFIGLLKLGAVEFGLVTVLALCGLVFFLRKLSPVAKLLLAFAVGYAGSVVAFFVAARYRLPVVPALIVFAAAAVDIAIESFKTRDRRQALKLGLSATLAAAIVFLPMPRGKFSTSYNSLGLYFHRKGEFAKAELCYSKAIMITPGYPDAYRNLSLLYHHLGDEKKAIAFEQRFKTLLAQTK